MDRIKVQRDRRDDRSRVQRDERERRRCERTICLDPIACDQRESDPEQ